MSFTARRPGSKGHPGSTDGQIPRVMRPISERQLPWENPGSPRGVGISLSGGGLRAAAFSLGVLQVLQEARGLLSGPHAARYVSAVSGGSYTAAAYALGGAERATNPGAYGAIPPLSEGSPEEEHIITHGNYLCPGLREMVLFAALNVTAFAALFVWGGTMLGGIAHLSDPAVQDLPEFVARVERAADSVGPVGTALLGILAAMTVAVWVRMLYAGRGYLFRILSLVPLLVFVGLSGPVIRAASTLGAGILVALPIVLGVFVVGSCLAVLRSAGPPAPTDGNANTVSVLLNAAALVAPRLLGLSLLLSASAGWYLAFSDAVGSEPDQAALLVPYFGILFGTLVFSFVPHRASLHRNYRDLLASCFAVVRDGATLKRRGGALLSDLRPASDATLAYPQFLVCATANVRAPNGKAFAHFVPFVLTNDVCGAPGYADAQAPTARLESFTEPAGLLKTGNEPMISLFTAVASAGAAVSPSMGRFTAPSIRFVATAFNLRLGRWIPNLFRADVRRKVNEQAASGPFHVDRAFGSGYDDLIPELTGVDGPRMYLTDGGHYDNLGLLAMLRARPETIWCVDASEDPGALAQELERVRVIAFQDMGVDISRPTGFGPVEDGLYSATHAVCEIEYERGARGTLIVVKLGLTSASSDALKARRDSDPGFPYHPTMPDQFYDTDRMEAYRDAGHEATLRAIATLQEES